MVQVIQIAGALAILGAFALLQTGSLHGRSIVYLGMNLAGSCALATTALLEAQWGFLMLNTAWALVAVLGLARLRVRRGAA